VVRHSLFNTGYDLNLTGAPLAGLDVNVEYPLEPLHLYALWVQVIDWRRSAGVLSSQLSPVGLRPLPRLAGVTLTRNLLFG
jgi:hypothetical protein